MPTRQVVASKNLVFYPMEKSLLGKIPMYQDAVSAGFPSPAEDHLELDLNLHEYLVQHPSATFCVRAVGDSMIKAGIHSGDVMVVDRAVTPQNNHIVLAVLNGEFTVKRIRKRNGSLSLTAENDAFKPIEITEESQFQVWGVVTHIIHKL